MLLFCETLSVDQTVNPSHKHTQSFLWLISVSVLFSVFLPAGSSAPLCLAVSYFIVLVGWLTPAHYEQVTRTRWRWRAMLDHWSLRVKYLVHCGRVGGNRLHKCVFCFASFFLFFFFLQKSLTLCIYAACACACFCLCLREIYIVIFPIRANTFCCLLVYCCLASCILFWEICLYPFFAKQRISTISNLCMLNVNIK